MRTRGKVLRVPNGAPGLVMIEGQQFRFSRESAWRSEVAPEPGLLVSVDLDRDLQVVAVTPIPEAQLEKERAEGASCEQPERRSEKAGLLGKVWTRFFGSGAQ